MDELDRLVANAEALLADGYYDIRGRVERSPSFLETLGTGDQPSDVIAELKFASPSAPVARSSNDFDALLDRLVSARPLGLSVLAEPRIFRGHVDFVRRAARSGLPVLFKDIVIDARQIDAAGIAGASTVLLIQALESRRALHASVQTLLDEAHGRDLDVLLEVHTPFEWDRAIETDADMLGINNRDLATMAVDLETTPRILMNRMKDRPVIAMSGIERREQVDAMLRAGADAVLVGTSLMTDADPARKLEELAHG